MFCDCNFFFYVLWFTDICVFRRCNIRGLVRINKVFFMGYLGVLEGECEKRRFKC